MEFNRRLLLTTSAVGIGLVGLGASRYIFASQRSSPTGMISRSSDFPKLPIGMNLAGIADWEPGYPFRNLFLGARSWVTANLVGPGPENTETQSSFNYDENGYPLQVPVASPGHKSPQIVFTYLTNS